MYYAHYTINFHEMQVFLLNFFKIFKIPIELGGKLVYNYSGRLFSCRKKS